MDAVGRAIAERGQVALATGRPRAVVDGSADIHRWARLGVWERLLALVQKRGVALGIAFLDGTSVRAHQEAGEAARRGALKRNGTCVKRSAGLVAALEARLA